MMRVSLVARFLLWSLLWLAALALPWYFLAPYLAVPAITLAGNVMQLLFGWVDGFERNGAVATLLTRVAVWISQGGRLVKADLTPEVNFLSYGYGTLLFWALMLASRPPRPALRIALGTLALSPVQACALCFHWLKDIAISAGPEVQEQARLGRWGLEFIAYGYQFGFLILTPLAPVLLWLLLDRTFMAKLWVEMSLAGALGGEHKAR